MNYDVALTFAGEDRAYVKKVAICLEENNVKFFYDENEEVDLWGKNLYDHLNDIYKNKAQFCVMFLSQHYKDKLWTNHERKAAQERAFKESREYILPVRFDNTEIPGINGTDFYLDGNKYTPEEICSRIIQKLGKKKNEEIIQPIDSFLSDVNIPTVRRTITDKEKNNFLNKSFSEIKEYFEKALKHLNQKNPHVESSLEDMGKKFIVDLYVEGKSKSKCKIWINGSFGNRQINYLEGNSFLSSSDDNSYNDYAYVKEDGVIIYFEILNMGFGNVSGVNKEKASGLDLAKYFWGRFIKNLDY